MRSIKSSRKTYGFLEKMMLNKCILIMREFLLIMYISIRNLYSSKPRHPNSSLFSLNQKILHYFTLPFSFSFYISEFCISTEGAWTSYYPSIDVKSIRTFQEHERIKCRRQKSDINIRYQVSFTYQTLKTPFFYPVFLTALP